ncbi:MAG: hypothetical protein H6586_09670 [Flavobacteriales bacterium]|nr:hypothetical protein [Flavobacteriales bacterium]
MADTTGTIIKLHPPHNTGSANGSGMVVADSGNAYVFHTPRDNNSLPISEGQTVNFTLDGNGHINSMTIGRES